jgi:hypothetical protein
MADGDSLYAGELKANRGGPVKVARLKLGIATVVSITRQSGEGVHPASRLALHKATICLRTLPLGYW